MFSIRVASDDLVFSAGHFITLDNGECERMHGHSYRVTAELHGPLDECQYVIDFIAVRDILKGILAELDHRVLLPDRNPTIHVASRTNEVEVSFSDRRWLFPAADCRVLPLANTTNELLAQYITERLSAELRAQLGERLELERMRIELSEGTGCSAACDMRGADLAGSRELRVESGE
jgi:6-pyruvoyltetrahydropterin/6-carboxytetrahydropterin synthase